MRGAASAVGAGLSVTECHNSRQTGVSASDSFAADRGPSWVLPRGRAAAAPGRLPLPVLAVRIPSETGRRHPQRVVLTVRIHGHRERGVGMPQPRRNHRDGHPAQMHQRRAGVPRVVQPHARDAEGVQHPMPPKRQQVRGVWLAGLVAGDVLARPVSLSGRHPLLKLPLAGGRSTSTTSSGSGRVRRLRNVNLNWPRRDGLNWPHLPGGSCGLGRVGRR